MYGWFTFIVKKGNVLNTLVQFFHVNLIKMILSFTKFTNRNQNCKIFLIMLSFPNVLTLCRRQKRKKKLYVHPNLWMFSEEQ